ncbi:zinc ribbon domain-containing protein [Lachnospiraceae bacterium 42-17]
MEKLLEIAEAYRKVKNYVYIRFGGIGGLSKIYPGYTAQNEMTKSGIRLSLNMPSVYFYLAVFDALGDIKSQWTRTKSKILELLNKNENFTSDEKHYLRFLLKVNNAFEQVLGGREIELKKEIGQQYTFLAERVDTSRLHRYLCRQVRKYHVIQHTEKAEGFSISERAYRYADHGIYIAIKEKRKRIFILLTDNNQYKSQLYVKLYPEDLRVEIKVPVHVAVRKHDNYISRVGAALGMYTMLTTDEGHCYGEELGKYQASYTDWINMQTKVYNCNREQNPGRKKYYNKKRKLAEQLHSYINRELNRFLETEKPETIYIAKLPRPQTGGTNRKINRSISQWQRGYIRRRLEQKCRERSVQIVEVIGKDISNECSRCGEAGSKEDGYFCCPVCGFRVLEKVNTACNIKKRGQGDSVLY